MTMAKGLTNAAIPMGAVAFSDDIYQTVMNATPGAAVEFFHGYTYSGHPVACAAASPLSTYTGTRACSSAPPGSPSPSRYRVFAARSADRRDLRGYGMLGAVDLAPAEKPGQRGYQVMLDIFEAGMLTASSAIASFSRRLSSSMTATSTRSKHLAQGADAALNEPVSASVGVLAIDLGRRLSYPSGHEGATIVNGLHQGTRADVLDEAFDERAP